MIESYVTYVRTNADGIVLTLNQMPRTQWLKINKENRIRIREDFSVKSCMDFYFDHEVNYVGKHKSEIAIYH